MLKIKAQNYVNKFTHQHGIRAEVPIEEETYVVDLANVMTGFGIYHPEAAYWRKGAKECIVMEKTFKDVSPECLKEAIKDLMKNDTEIEIEVDENWDIK